MNGITPVLAIIVPCLNEEEVLHVTMQKLSAQLDLLISLKKVDEKSYISFVDDGSRDGTWDLIERFSKNGKVKGIKLSNNFGHQNALLAGLFLEKDKADCMVTIDADLQDDETVIEQMIDKFTDGNMIVYGVRSNRDTDSFLKRNLAHVFYRFMNLLGIKTIYNHADFRLAGRQAIENLEQFNEVNLFLRGIFPLLGFRSDIVYYNRSNRSLGTSKYPIRKMADFAWQGITSFNISLLRFVTFAGILMFLISVITAIWVLISYFSGNSVKGWASILLIITTFSGINMICLGLIGEYVGKIFLEVKQRPRFIIERTTA